MRQSAVPSLAVGGCDGSLADWLGAWLSLWLGALECVVGDSSVELGGGCSLNYRLNRLSRRVLTAQLDDMIGEG